VIGLESTLGVVLSGVLGLLIGSFANVCIHRIPLRESVVAPRSRCPSCRVPIAPKDNVPLVSWVILGGRCRACKATISARYPLVELSNGLGYVLVAAIHGLDARALVEMAFLTSLLILGLIDYDHHILPDAITLPGIAAGVGASFIPGPPSPMASMASAGGAYLGFAMIAKLYERARGIEGLGQGDWKMAAMLGAFLGWQQTLFAVFLGAAIGSLVGVVAMVFLGKGSRHALPFGTFLALGAACAVFVGEPTLRWYSGLYSR
jgi:leader peptidase (prepilin peptidase) / N-methyltransferase